nr:hypothetical protein [Tanacetum cinerariifolium]
MEAESTTNTMTTKLPILNPEEYDLWLMRIEQYFLMTDYSLWEVIKNGNKVQKRTIGTRRCKEETRNPRRLQKLISLLRSIPSEWKTHALIWRNKANIETPNSPHLAREDLEQIDLDDLEERDLHWEIAMLTIRARRFIKRTCRNLDINGQKIGSGRSKVECFNCHKNAHFARECRAPKNQENRGREYGRKTIRVENPTEYALITQDRIRGYDWSYKAEE